MEKRIFKNKIVPVFIDNCVFKNMHFDFTHAAFNTLKAACHQGHLQLLVTPILKEEFLRHSQDSINTDKINIQNIVVLKTFLEKKIHSLKKDSEKIDSAALWKKFEKDFKVEMVDADLDWRPIFKDYFLTKPPFTSDKKKEFPDAFNIKLIETKLNESLITISSDEGFSSWAEKRKGIYHYKSLPKFISDYLKVQGTPFGKIGKKAIRCFSKLENGILEYLVEYYSDYFHYSIISENSEILYANVAKLSTNYFDLIEVNVNENFAVFDVSVSGESTLELNCPVVVWDSVDKEEIHQGSNSRSTKVRIEIHLIVKIHMDIEDYEVAEKRLVQEEFTVPDSWTSFLDYDED